ncbi:uncharacterized protein LOC113352699 [Papaver somniferum]|uniref:uncharacterized protein LOC113352699 n=1 Tax=Papaver somniferum TaxID=3469 RepID=UPI000E6F98AB|nr:uncharacterized protein LOC113352699 [Papaver somniferum]
MGKNKTKSTVKNNVKQFPIKMKKKPKSQQSQSDVASPPHSASLCSKRRSPRNYKFAEPTVPTSPIDTNTSQRRSSPRFKESAEPNDTNTSQRGSSSRSKESTEPTNPQSTRTPSHQKHLTSPCKTLASKRKKVLKPTKSKEDAANSKEGDFEEEEEDETLQHNIDVQKEDPDVDSDGEKDNGDDSEASTDDKMEGEEDEVVEPNNKRKFVPRGPVPTMPSYEQREHNLYYSPVLD